ncbi:MAG: Ig-like domain repeat protein, partial [Planctomycetes bacterium]|nr:Ig-like domain repeat protein [Planctomycetota bacterium]
SRKSAFTGAAYVFARNQGGADNWGQVKKLIATDGASGDKFGSSVSIDGDAIVVGAQEKSSGQGAAYVFTRNQGGVDNWGQVKKLTASDGASGDGFGVSAAIDGDTIVVGASRKSAFTGAAYVFARNQGGSDQWAEVQTLIRSDAGNYEYFGNSVAIDGDTIVVGAYNDDVGSNDDQGSAYTFVRQGDSWRPSAQVAASDGAADDYFGNSVAVDGDTLVVGAKEKSNGRGAAYVFARNQGGADNWGQVKKLTASDGAGGDYFGTSVAIDGDTIVVGANNIDAAYVFARNRGGSDQWGEVKKITTSDGASVQYFGTSVAVEGDTIAVGAERKSSNRGAAYLYVPALGTTTTLAASPNPSTYGQPVTFTATVTSTDGTPDGVVAFRIDGSTVATATLSSGTATYVTSTLAVGSHAVTAIYGGGGDLADSSDSLDGGQTVNKVATTTNLASSPSPSSYGQAVTFTATVTSTGGTPTGVVTFTIDSSTVATATLSGGIASYVTSTLGAGAHTSRVAYAGNANLSSSESPTRSLTVNKAATTTTMASSPNPSTYGQPVTFTATVTSTGGTTTGVVTFSIHSLTPVTATLSGGTATYVTSTLDVGDHMASVAYGGDANFNSSSGSLDGGQTVNKADTTTALASSPNPSAYGQSVTFTATVTSAGGTPTGVVTFTVDGSTMATVPLTDGIAEYVTPSLGAGPHSVSAAYSGDPKRNASSSTAITQTVNKADTTTALSSSPKPSAYCQTVTFTATVTSSVGTPSGGVTLTVDDSLVGTATLSGGEATYTTSSIG